MKSINSDQYLMGRRGISMLKPTIDGDGGLEEVVFTGDWTGEREQHLYDQQQQSLVNAKRKLLAINVPKLEMKSSISGIPIKAYSMVNTLPTSVFGTKLP